jgi:predicted nucleic acid-binding OB-fold protein
MAPSKLVAAKARKSLTKEEKEVAFTSFWMQKKMASVKISDNDAKLIYKKMVKASSSSKNKQKIPSFESVKNNIKMQLAQEKVVAKLMKNAKIKIK